jgi:hypothetical protein
MTDAGNAIEIGSAVLVVALTGSAGGLLNCILSDGGFIKPQVSSTGEGKRIFDPGFLNNIVLGIGASLIVWAFGASSYPWAKQIGTLLIAGVAGGSLILGILQRSRILEQKNLLLETRSIEATKVQTYDAVTKQLASRLKEALTRIEELEVRE